MRKGERGITLIVLAVTIVVMLIIAGITIGSITGDEGIIKESGETVQNAQRESIIEKIEADLYTEKVKKGTQPTKNDLKEIIKKYGTPEEESFTSKEGKYIINYNEIQGWK